MERPARYAVRGTRGALATGSGYASEAGMRLYHQGGNAVDAGVAAMFTAAVTEFSHFGFGGEASILIRGKDGRVHAIAGVGTMPKLATADFFRTRRLEIGEVLMREPGGSARMVPVAGLLPALVPGMVDGALLALREFGNKSFADVIQPAIEHADGMVLDETRANSLAMLRRWFDLWPTSRNVYGSPGRIASPGQIFHQPDLARTLRSMLEAEKKALKAGAGRTAAIDAVRDHFYRGDIARRIDAFSQANGGLLRYEDLAAFRLRLEEPASTTYREYKVYKPGFWSQGPAMLQALNILETDDLQSLRRNSEQYIHTLVEALKLAYADRDAYYGDPSTTSVPAERLLSKQYASERRTAIGESASLEFRPGQINGYPAMHPSQSRMARREIDDILLAKDTTCVDAIDRDGIVFASTPSGSSLPAVVAGDTGIPLSHRAQSFFLIPGHPNELAGGKRPRITLSPALVTRAGKPYLALSTPGGDNQVQSLLQILLNVIEFRMNAQQAVEAPRFQSKHLVSSFDNHAMSPGELLLDERIPVEVRAGLGGRGHKIGVRTRWSSGSHPVMVRMLPNGVIEAGADPYGYRTADAW